MVKTRRSAKPGLHRFNRHQIELPDGRKLEMHEDGTIVETGEAAEAPKTWPLDDPEWARLALRFGVLPPSETTVPERPRRSSPRPR